MLEGMGGGEERASPSSSLHWHEAWLTGIPLSLLGWVRVCVLTSVPGLLARDTLPLVHLVFYLGLHSGLRLQVPQGAQLQREYG